jgi:phosphatidylglycerol:prolipoprotein diacylglycerol transferase
MLVHPDFDPVVFHIAGPLKQPHSALTPHQVDDMVFYGMIGVIVGGRIGSTLFYHFPEFIGNPLIVFRIWDGGMSFHGGFLGVLLVMWWYAKKQQLAFFTLMDFVAPLVPLGLGAGRMGNFINQELVGRPTDLPWGMIFPVTGDGIPRHPSQLYQATLEGLVLFLVLWFYSAKSPPRMAVSALFLSGYGLFRFAVEFVRTPDAHLGFIALGWLTMGQILSLPMIVIGVWMLWYSYQNKVTESA